MPRLKRILRPDFCYHITVRCNNREFRLTRYECRSVLLYAIQECQKKYGFKLYALCIMSNHVHYLIEPQQPQDLPQAMHWLNWYTAMCFNRMLNRTGHFWEKRYHSSGFPMGDYRRALNTIRYIHANPKAADMQRGFFYDFSNYGSYERLTQDGLTQWHPAFLDLGASLDECAEAYKRFCIRYQPKPKSDRKNTWGSQLLKGLIPKKGKRKPSPGQQELWENARVEDRDDVKRVTEKFIEANKYPEK
ncbi:transposase [Leptolyngbya cf. ectocarpi LEGE 11479]|uniref:Transposase n=1 Tax=Leptolyngbya cf. ectocarpi LEGE 11479 TaxID=1828722 RepID=A0A929FBW8_LEPEC|nr:transposase [Leptolyngbya ectocarpi]MBE9069502.1 transposase [Leptolyngbya cf. ectocarpi LEGE 11479]